MRRLALLGALLLGAVPLAAQDTTGVFVIDPDAPPIQIRSASGPPAGIVAEAVANYNDSTATRIFGAFTVASGTSLRGNVVVYRGTLRVVGRVIGQITVINGNLVVGPLGTVEGDVLILGGRLQVAPSGRHTGSARTYAEPAFVFRTTSGTLEIREQPATLSDLAAARASFQAGPLKTSLSIETGDSYNRVEGLSILAGPTFTVATPNRGEVRAEFWGLLRTEKDKTEQLPTLGWRTRMEWSSKARMSGGIGVRWENLVVPIDDRQLSRSEVGLGSFLFNRDYDDYFQTSGIEGYVYLRPVPALRLEGSARSDRQTTVPASDPISLFPDDDPWRANPLVDDGHYRTLRLQADVDSRNNVRTPTSGWRIRAWFEHASSDDVAPVALPSEVRSPIPVHRLYGYSHVGFDVRHYARINQISRTNLRLLGGGWVAGDPLPIQQRLAMGGPGILPGHGFRSQTCAPASLTDPSQTGLCDRFLAAQAEVRFRIPLSLRDVLGAQEWLLLDRLLGGDLADLVVFGDAGKAWLTGDGPGRVPTNRIPTFSEWAYDVGLGIDLGGLAVFVAQPLNGSGGARLTLRFQRRF
jgi:hypothetical protein